MNRRMLQTMHCEADTEFVTLASRAEKKEDLELKERPLGAPSGGDRSSLRSDDIVRSEVSELE
jgi:hypothetical protein